MRHVRVWSALLAVVFCLPSCTTALLWDWASEEEPPGQLAGVLPDAQRGDLVVYEFAETDEAPAGWKFVRIAPEWRAMPRRVMAGSPTGDALAVADPAQPITGVLLTPSPSHLLALRELDYRSTIGRDEVDFAAGELPYGFVALRNDADEVVHEIYGYDLARGQWVLVGVINLGAYRTDAGRVTAGIALTPVTVVADFAILALVVCAISGGGNVSGLDFPSGGGGGSTRPVHYRERARYWEELQAAPLR